MRACAAGTNGGREQSVKRWMNVGVELPVQAFRLCSLSAVVSCCIHVNFLCDILCIFQPPSIPCLSGMWGCVCLRPVYIGWCTSVSMRVQVLSVCDCMLVPVLQTVVVFLLFCCHRNTSSSTAAAPVTTFPVLLFPSVTQNRAAFSSSRIISSPCRLQAVAQQLDSDANERAPFPCLRDISFDLIHEGVRPRISHRLTSAPNSPQRNPRPIASMLHAWFDTVKSAQASFGLVAD